MDGEFWNVWIIPYIMSNFFASFLAFTAWRKPNAAKILYAVLFLAAAGANTSIVLNNPHDYINYASYAWPPYPEFIRGYFTSIITPMVLLIALGQLLIGLAFFANGKTLQLASLGAIIFFMAITPLGLGAAFPFTVLASLGCVFIFSSHQVEPDAAKKKIYKFIPLVIPLTLIALFVARVTA